MESMMSIAGPVHWTRGAPMDCMDNLINFSTVFQDVAFIQRIMEVWRRSATRVRARALRPTARKCWNSRASPMSASRLGGGERCDASRSRRATSAGSSALWHNLALSCPAPRGRARSPV